MTKDELFGKIEWEGGLLEAITGYGLSGEDFTEAGYSTKVVDLVDTVKNLVSDLKEALEFEGFWEHEEEEE